MKKLFLLVALTGVMFPALAQKYTLTGVAPVEVKKIYFMNLEGPRQIDSTEVTDGKFYFSGDAQGKLFARVYTKDGLNQGVVLDGNVRVDMRTHTASGTKENEAMSPWTQRYQTFEERQRAILAVAKPYGKNIPDTLEQRLITEWNVLSSDMQETLLQLLSEHKEQIFPAYFLRLYGEDLGTEQLINVLGSNAIYTSASVLQPMKEKLERKKNQMVGVQFTDLTLPDTAGVAHQLSEYVGKGKYVLIDFWASWCGPCLREIPNVKLAYERFHKKGFDIVGLSFDRDRKNWIGAIKRLELPWIQLSDLKFWETEAAKVYGVDGIPLMLLVDPSGKIIANDLRGEALQQKLEELLGK